MLVVGGIHYVALPLALAAGEPRPRLRGRWCAALGIGLVAT
jgi:hypothetical protein